MTHPAHHAEHSSRQVIGVADVGSNSIKTRIVEGTREGSHVLADIRYPVRLGRGSFSHGRILEEDIAGGVTAFRDFAQRCRDLGAARIMAVGTSALRDAANTPDFIVRVERESGVQIQIISGDEEARLIALGSMTTRDAGRSHLVMDIGGGSTEIISTDADNCLTGAVSLQLGAVRLAEELGMPACYTSDHVAALQGRVSGALQASALPAAIAAPITIGTGGTLRALADLCAGGSTTEPTITRRQLRDLLSGMSTRTVSQLVELYGLDEKRAQIIIPGITILAGLMDYYGTGDVAVRDCGIRDGLVNELLSDPPLPVVAGVVRCNGKILVARRAPGKHLAGYWEFPGGKVEPGESARECLIREIMEEFHLAVTVGDYIAGQTHRYGDRSILLHAYHAAAASPCDPGNSHDAVAWITPAELTQYTMAPADEFICRALTDEDDAPE